MENNMTCITRRMFEKATSEQMTVSSMAGFLEREAKIRTLREKFEMFFHGCEMEKTLLNGLFCNHPDMSRHFIEKRVDGWLNHPECETLKTSEAIEVCFIFKLTIEEADSFVALVTEEGLHWRNPREIVYIFALKQGMDFLEAEKLNEEMKEYVSGVQEGKALSQDSFTPVIRTEVSALGTKEELADFLAGAAARLGQYHNNAYQLFMDMMELLENPRPEEGEAAAGIFEPEKLTIRDIVREYLYGENVLYAREMAHTSPNRWISLPEEEKIVLTRIQEKISGGWPDEEALSKMKSREMDVTRKVLILLFLATDQGAGWEDEYETDVSLEEIFEDLYQRLNDMLAQCGFMTLDPRSPFDWVILYCICVEDMFDVDIRMKSVFQEMFGGRS